MNYCSHIFSYKLILYLKMSLFFEGHQDRILNMTMSPDHSTMATIAADETIRMWESFEVNPAKKAKERMMMKPTSGGLHQSIR